MHWVSELPIETTSIQRMLTGTRCISRTSKRTSSHSTTWYQRHTVSWRHKTEGKGGVQGKVSELSRDIIAPRRVLGCWGIVVQKPQDTPCP